MDILKNIYVINLDRRPDRLKEFYNRLPFDSNKITRISAVDGNNIIYERNENPFVMGCHQSHKNILQIISSNNFYSDNDLFLILEDDCFFSKFFIKSIKNINLIDKSSLFMLYIGGRFKVDFLPSKIDGFEQYKENIFEKVGTWKDFLAHDYDRTTHAYIINKKTAKEILNKTKDVKISFPIDSLYNSIKRYVDNIKIYDMFPHICYSPANYKTDIQISKK